MWLVLTPEVHLKSTKHLISERIARDMVILLFYYAFTIIVLILVEHNNGAVLYPPEP